MTPECRLDEDRDDVLWWIHDCRRPATGERIEIAGRLPLGKRGWTLVQADPLTVEPSILCHACGTHGWFRDGKWIGT